MPAAMLGKHSYELVHPDDLPRTRERLELPLGLVLLDVDHFKSFNDRYGHLGGDDCLRRVSHCIRDAQSDDHTARYGGEEIAILLPATDVGGSAEVAHRVCGAVASLRIEHSGGPFDIVTVSAVPPRCIRSSRTATRPP